MDGLARGGERNPDRQQGRRISRRSATSPQPVRNSLCTRQARLRVGGDRRRQRRSRSGRRRPEDRRPSRRSNRNAQGEASRYAAAPGVFRDDILIFLEDIEKFSGTSASNRGHQGSCRPDYPADGSGPRQTSRIRRQESDRIRSSGAGRNSAHQGSTADRAGTPFFR